MNASTMDTITLGGGCFWCLEAVYDDLLPGERRTLHRARGASWDYFETMRHGIFCELGRGSVDFPGMLDALRGHGYDDWIVVEQDVLPGMGSPAESARRNREYLRRLGL